MIRALSLANLRTFRDAMWQPITGVNVVISHNDAGKTSVRLALEYLLGGRASGVTDEAGRGAEALIRHGENEAVVELLVEGADGEVFGVRRTIYASSKAAKLEVQGATGSTRVLEEILERRLGAGPGVVSAALNSGRFLDLSVADQQAMILRLAGATWTAEEIAAALSSDQSRTALRMIGADQLAGGPEVLDTIEKRAREARPAEKRSRDSLESELKATPAPRLLPADQAEALRQRVASFNAERDGLQRDAGAAMLQASRRKGNTERRDRLQREIDELQAKIDQWAAVDVDVARRDESEGRAALAAADAACQESERALAAADQALTPWLKALHALRESVAHGSCPFCTELRCGLDAAAALPPVQARVSELEAAVRAAQGSHSATVAFRGGVKVEADSLRNRLQTAEANAAALSKARESLASKQSALAEVQSEIDDPESIANAQEIADRVNLLDQQLATMRAALNEHERAQQASVRLEDLRHRLEDARARYAALDALCDEFRAGGVRQRLLGPVLEGFLEHANAVLSSSGAQVQFAGDGSLGVTSSLWPGVLGLAGLSRSMRLRVGVALQHALCQLAHWRLLLIDDADALDVENRNVLLETLLSMASAYSTIIVLVAQPTDELPADPGVEGLAFWTIDQGQFVRLGPGTSPMEAGGAA